MTRRQFGRFATFGLATGAGSPIFPVTLGQAVMEAMPRGRVADTTATTAAAAADSCC
jgi:hypothetical protein